LSGATGWKIRGSNPSTTKSYFSCASHPYLFWGPQSLLFNAYRDSSPRKNRSQAEADKLPLSRAKVKNEWSYAPTPSISLHGVVRDFALFTLHVKNIYRNIPNNKYSTKQRVGYKSGILIVPFRIALCLYVTTLKLIKSLTIW